MSTTSASAAAPHKHAAGIIPVYPGGAILLQLRDDRPDVAAPNCWSTIGGHIEPGETPLEAAAREMGEETGRRPDTIIPAGYLDHPSGHRPGIIVRSHIFATSATWSLDDLIIGEGQRLDWFTPAEVPSLRLAAALAPAVLGFLGSDLHRSLAGNAPPSTPPLMPPLPVTLPAALGIAPGSLVAVHGISAGFVRRLAECAHGARITSSPGGSDRPDITLWQPRLSPTPADFEGWHSSLTPDASLWMLTTSRHDAAAVRSHARSAGFTTGAPLRLPDGSTAHTLHCRHL